MSKLEKISLALVLGGIVLIVYGWITGISFSLDNIVETIAKKYAYMSTGFVLAIMGYVTDVIRKHIDG